ncbi:MAG TPA: transglycosylase SLT domain-containing protein [Candidatus Kryptonia bacterium]|nr:transglycosylase SLT domain-containing protein [Candidatus Kryptonia bacterium]
MREIAHAAPRGLGKAAATVFVVWQLSGCAAGQRPVTFEYAAFPGGGSSSPYSIGHSGIYGPPASAALPRPTNGDFSVSHPRVNDFVATYQTRWRGFYQRALDRGSRYLSRMTRVLREESVPEELAYLPIVESGFRTQAVSQAGAVGPWQFIPATGRRYGLRIDGYVDERRDPVKSTHAAARYLKDLYAQFGDWHLSLAAYNTGEMNIARLLDRSKTDNYWDMSDRGYLPNETRDFVPQFLAAVRIAQAPEAYGFEPPSGDPVHYDLVRIDRSVSLKTVAKFANASEAEMTELNPALRRGVTPPQGYTVRVPKGTKAVVQIALARMHHDAAQVMPAPRTRTTAVARTYKVRRGETLTAVAKRHRVSVASLKQANRLRSDRIAAGRALRIPGHASAVKGAADKKPVRVASRHAR